jgi:hypothetical protein
MTTKTRNRRTKAELEEMRRAIEWKAALHSIADDVIRDAMAGDPFCRSIVAKTVLGPLLQTAPAQ